MPRFHLAPHIEKTIERQRMDRERFRRFAESWATDDRAISIASRAGIVGARNPDAASAIIAASDLPLTDNQINQALFDGLQQYVANTFNTVGEFASMNQQMNVEAKDSTQNNEWNMRMNPAAFGTEALQWWQRSPGAAVADFGPMRTAPVRGTSRVFMLFADAAVDLVSDRVWRAGTEAFAQGHNPAEWLNEFADEYLGDLYGGSEGDVIGNKPFWGMLGEVSGGRPVNLSTGFIPNSELSAAGQDIMTGMEQDVGQYAKGQYDLYAEDPEAWGDQASYATPYSQSLWYEAGKMKQTQREVINAPGQAQLGKPLTQAYDLKAEGYVRPLGTMSEDFYKGMEYVGLNPAQSVDGRPHLTRVSGGRIMAGYLAEPGTKESQYVSGFGDFSKQIGLDPLNLVGSPGKLTKGARAVGLTEAGVEAARKIGLTEDAVRLAREAPSAFEKVSVQAMKKTLGGGMDLTPQRLGEVIDQVRRADTVEEAIVLTNRARQTVDPKKANRFLTGGQAQPMVEALARTTKMKEVDTLLTGVKGRIPASLRRNLVEATTETEVIEALLPHLDSGLKLQGNLSTWGEIAAAGSLSEYFLGQGLLRAPVQAGRAVLSSPYAIVDKTVELGLDALHAEDARLMASPMRDLTMRARMRYQYGNTWVGRMVNDVSNKGVDPADIDKAYVQVEQLARNGGISTDDIWATTNKGRQLTGKTMEDISSQLNRGERLKKVHDMDAIMRDLAALGPNDDAGVADVMKRLMNTIGVSMQADGVDESFIRGVTRLWEETLDDRLYFVNSVGETVDYPGTGYTALVNGEQVRLPGPQLLNEFHKGVINVPDPRLLRRTLAEGHAPGRFMNRLTTQKVKRLPKLDDIKELSDLKMKNWDDYGQTLADRAYIRFTRQFFQNVWKPAKLLRLGYPIKIVLGDEQARMGAVGLSNFWSPWRPGQGDSPLSYLAMVLSENNILKKLGDPLKARRGGVVVDDLALASEFQNAVSLRGNGMGEIGAMTSDRWNVAAKGTDNYVDGLATEIAQLIDDPLVPRLFDAEAGGIDNLKQWLLSDDPEAIRLLEDYYQAIRRTNPLIADDFRSGGQAMDHYLQSLEARAHLKTGGDYVVVDPNTGNVLDSSDNVIGKAGEGEWTGFESGYRITRPGQDVLIGAIRDKTIDGNKVTGLSTAGYNELKKAVRGQFDDNADLFPEAVKYSIGNPNGPANNPGMARQIMDRFMDWIIAKPAENFSRSPTYTQIYWRTAGSYLPDLTDDAAEQLLARAKKAGQDGVVLEQARRAGKGTKSMGVEDLENIDGYARAMAAEATVDLLFDFAKRKNALDGMSLILPFGDAFFEAITSYGRIFANDPAIARRPLKATEEMRKTNPMDWGEDEFDPDKDGFFHVNGFGEEVFSLPWNPTVGGTEMQFDIPIGSLNIIANQMYPVAGPVISVPAASLLPDGPAWQGVRDFIAPFGLADSTPEALIEETVGASPTLNRFLAAFTQGKFPTAGSERAFNQMRSWVIREGLATGEWSNEEFADPDGKERILEEANRRVRDMYLIRGALQAVMPASPTSPTLFPTIEDGDPARYEKLALQDATKAFYDILRDEADNDWETAQQSFLDRYGYESLPFLVSFYKENAKMGVTFDSWAAQQTFSEVYASLPRTAYYLQPDDPSDPFYYKAWDAQFKSSGRELKTTEEWADDYTYRVAAGLYSQKSDEAAKMLADGTIAAPTGIDDDEYLSIIEDRIKKDIIDNMPGYRQEVDQFTRKDQQESISELREWGQYDRLKNDPTAKTISEFFSVWDEAFQAQLDAGIGTKSAVVLPFVRAGVVSVKKDGTISESWAVRSAVNAELLRKGDELAKRPGNGNFELVWEDVIKPSIYDYRAEVKPQKQQVDPIDDLVSQLMGVTP